MPVLVLALARVTLLSHFPSTHGLFDDWYNHAQYFPLFVLGAMLARDTEIWVRMAAIRWVALGIALLSWAALLVYFSLPEAFQQRTDFSYWQTLMRVVWVLCAWCAMVAACGFARAHLNQDSAQRAYLSQAAFPVYIVHQTLIVSLAHLIKPAQVAPATEALVLVVLTLCLSFGIVEVVRRQRLLRPLFGMAAKTEPGQQVQADRAQAYKQSQVL